MHRLDLGLYSHPKQFLRNGVRTHVNCKENIPTTRKILLRVGSNPRHCTKQDSEPNTLPMNYSGPVTPSIENQAGSPNFYLDLATNEKKKIYLTHQWQVTSFAFITILSLISLLAVARKICVSHADNKLYETTFSVIKHKPVLHKTNPDHNVCLQAEHG